MKKLQIKYCYSEDEANEFLKTLFVEELKYPRLHSIQYCAKVNGNGIETAEANAEGITAQAQVDSNVIAVVQYFVEA